MADVNLTLLTDLLVEDVAPSVNDQLKYEALLFAMLKKNAGVTALNNFNFTMPVRTGRSSGTYGVSESNNNVVYGAPGYDETVLTAKTVTTAFKMTHQSLAVKDKGSAVPLFEQVTKDVSDDYMHAVNRMAFGDGSAKIGDAASSGTSSTAFTFAASTNGDIDFAEYAPVGSYIKIGSANAVQVTAVTGTNAVTLSSAISWSSGDDVILVNTTGASTTASGEITGLGKIIGTTTALQNIDGSSNPFWQSYRQNLAGALSSESTLNEVYTKRQKQANTKFIVCNATMFSDWAGLLTSQKRVVNSSQPLGAGWSGLEFMGGKASIILDFDCPDDRFIGIDPEALTVAELEAFHFLQGDSGHVSLNRIPGTLNYEVIGVHIFELACKRRNALWEVYGITS